MIKVALIGAHNTGKTTICHQLVAELKKRDFNADYLVEIAREAQRVGFPINEGTTKEAQRWIALTQIARELEPRPGIQILVTDRSALDNYVYSTRKFGESPELDSLINAHMPSYDLLFKVPINPDYRNGHSANDGVRSVDPIFQEEIDALIDDTFKKRGILFVPYTTIDSALEMILEKLR